MTGVPVATKIEVGIAMLVAEVVRVLFLWPVLTVEAVTMVVEMLDSALVVLVTV